MNVRINNMDGLESWSGEIKDLRVGDLIVFGQSQRLIRAKAPRFTNHGRNFAGYLFYFAIKRSSWTNSCYTIYTECDMKEKFKGLIKRNVRLVSRPLELRVQQEIFKQAYVSSYKGGSFTKHKIYADEMAGAII